MAIIRDIDATPETDAAITAHVDAYDPATGNSWQRARHRKYAKRRNDADFDAQRYLTAKSCEYFKQALSGKKVGTRTAPEYTTRLTNQFVELFRRGAEAGVTDYATAEIVRQSFLRALDAWSAAKPEHCPRVPADAIAALVTEEHSEHFANVIHADRLSTVRRSDLFGFFLLHDQFDYTGSKDWALKKTLSGNWAWLSKPAPTEEEPNPADPNAARRQQIDGALALAHTPYLLRDIAEYIGDAAPGVLDPAVEADTYHARIVAFLDDDHFPGDGAAKKLRAEEKKLLLVTLRDKLRLNDVQRAGFGTYKSLEVYWMCYELLAERISEARRAALLEGLGEANVLLLIERCFSGTGPYYNLREGSYHVVVAIRRNYDVGTPIRDIVEGLLSTWYDYTKMTELTRNAHYGPVDAPLDAATLKTQLEEHADSRVDEFIAWVKGDMKTKLNQIKGRVLVADVEALATDALKATAKVYNRAAGDVDALMAWVDETSTRDHFIAFLRVFGFRPKHTFESSRNGPQEGTQVLFQCMWQILLNVRTLADPDKTAYADGLRRIGFALPTAGKPLRQFHYVSSQLETIAAVVADIGEGTLADYPFMVFDQSTANVFDQNAAYLGELTDAMDANIHHIGIRAVVDLANTLEITEFFITTEVDTREHWLDDDLLAHKHATGRLNCGYGGCRNIVAVFGAMFHLALRAGTVATFAELKDLDEAVLARLLRRALFEKPFLVMGDDDLTLLPGFMHSKAAIAHCIARPPIRRQVQLARGGAQVVRDEVPYVKVMTLIQGRGTTTVPGGALETGKITGYANKLDLCKLIGAGVGKSISWNDVRLHKSYGAYSYATALMAGNLLHPASCADLPHPTEEKVMNGMVSIVDQLGHTLHHPTDRYDSLPKRNLGLCFYVQKIELATTVTGYAGGYTMPWNTPAGSLGETYTKALEAETKTAYQEHVLAQASGWTGHNKLKTKEEVAADFAAMRTAMAAAFRADPLLLKEVNELEAGYKLLCTERDAAVFYGTEALRGIDDPTQAVAIGRGIAGAVNAWNDEYDSDESEVRLRFRKSNLTHMMYLSIVSVIGGRFYRLLGRIIHLCNEHAADPELVAPPPELIVPVAIDVEVGAAGIDNPPVELIGPVADEGSEEGSESGSDEEERAAVKCVLCEEDAPAVYECTECQTAFSVCAACAIEYHRRVDTEAEEMPELCSEHLPARV